MYARIQLYKRGGDKMAGKTEAQKQAQKNYLEKFVTYKVRLTREEAACIKVHAYARGENINNFLKRAIYETVDHDNGLDRLPPELLEKFKF